MANANSSLAHSSKPVLPQCPASTPLSLSHHAPSPEIAAHLLAQHMDVVLVILNVAERLMLVSQNIMDATEEDEPYETLVLLLKGLHAQLVELSCAAARAKAVKLDQLELDLW